MDKWAGLLSRKDHSLWFINQVQPAILPTLSTLIEIFASLTRQVYGSTKSSTQVTKIRTDKYLYHMLRLSKKQRSLWSIKILLNWETLSGRQKHSNSVQQATWTQSLFLLDKRLRFWLDRNWRLMGVKHHLAYARIQKCVWLLVTLRTIKHQSSLTSNLKMTRIPISASKWLQTWWKWAWILKPRSKIRQRINWKISMRVTLSKLRSIAIQIRWRQNSTSKRWKIIMSCIHWAEMVSHRLTKRSNSRQDIDQIRVKLTRQWRQTNKARFC